MQRIAFKMRLLKGYVDEYKKRHDDISIDLKNILKRTGIKDYSIFFDEETNYLFAYLTIDDATKLNELSNEPAMKKWWAYMKDIMETNVDTSPTTVPLKEIFYLS